MFSETDKSRLKGISTALRIITKIIQILLCVAVAFEVMALIIVPLIMGAIHIDENGLSIGNESIASIETTGEKIAVNVGEKEIVSLNVASDLGVNFKNLIEGIKLKDMSFYIVMYIMIMIFSISATFIVMLMYHRLSGIFKLITKNETAFVEENVKNIRLVAIFYVISYVLKYISRIFVAIAVSSSFGFGSPLPNVNVNLGIELTEVVIVLGIVAIYYAYKYGVSIENKKAVKAENTTEAIAEN